MNDSWMWTVIGGISLMCAGGAMLLLARPRDCAPAPVVTPASAASISFLPSAGNQIRVHTADRLLDELQLRGLWESIRQRCSFTADNFERDCAPVLRAVAEFCQLLPASESHHHAQPGGLLIHLLEVVNHALGFRASYTLPRGVPVEDIGLRQHLWTYGVFVGALLHDIGKPMADLVIQTQNPDGTAGTQWNPLSGSLVECGVQTYSVSFNPNRTYGEHQRLPVILAQRIIPRSTLQWMSTDPELMQALMAYLGDSAGAKCQDKNLIAEIVGKADGESVRHNLRAGSRKRFATARATPLIERMMGALCQMLSEPGTLPLNRPGAVGWIYRGEAWFVCKRLVEELRQALIAKGDGDGIPGPDKDDRIYDVFQEYGAVISNPLTHGAIWHIRIELEQWASDMRVLRFPLEKLYREPSQYPGSIAGRITILDAGTNLPRPLAGSSSETAPEMPITEAAAASSREASPQNLSPDPVILESASAPEKVGTESVADLAAVHEETVAISIVADQLPENLSADEFFDDTESASALHAEVQRQKPVASTSAPPTRAEVLPPVVPATPALPPLSARDENCPPDLALQFMRWLQEGIAQGTLAVNTSQAPVHLVKEGLLLVSPRIFRQFTNDTQLQDAAGAPIEYTAVQTALCKARWHYVAQKPGYKGKKTTRINILRYVTAGADGAGATAAKPLSGIVILQPERFVNPVPPINECLTYREDITLGLNR